MKRYRWLQGLYVTLLSFLVIIAIMLVFSLIGTMLELEEESDAGQVYSYIWMAVSLLGGSLCILLCKRPPHDDLIRQLPPNRKLSAGMLLTALLTGICFSFWVQITLTLVRYGHIPPDNHLTGLSVSLSDSGYPFAKIWLSPFFLFKAFVSCICFPIYEELTCRGVLFSSFRTDRQCMAAAIISSAIFAVLHLDLYRIPDTFLFGLLLCLTVKRTDSLLMPLLSHFGFNLVAAVTGQMVHRSMLYRAPALCIAAALTLLAAFLLIRCLKKQPPLPEPILQEEHIAI